MKFGCCVSLQRAAPQVNGDRPSEMEARVAELRRKLEHLKTLGYEFAEFGVGMVTRPSEPGELDLLQSLVDELQFRPVAFNAFVPPDIPLIGQRRDAEQIKDYVHLACQGVKRLGGRIIVFGSGAARRIPEGFPADEAWDQAVEFMTWCSDIGQDYGITFAVEHLRRAETNLINSFGEALRLAKEVGRPNVKVLADYYHMLEENEDPSSLEGARGWVVHVHVADNGRISPGKGDADFAAFFRRLKAEGYQGGISIESRFDDFYKETEEAIGFLKQQWESC